jgi:aspartyl-tRNA(Asn)/glutamyl-tRNA(Gln) amidotransferase subunit A
MAIGWSAVQIRDAVLSGHAAARDIVQAFLDRIDVLDPKLHAFTFVARQQALERAADIDREDAGARAARPLLGVPVAVKDNISTRGIPTTASSRILEGYVPPFDATVIERLHAAGAIVIGKTNCDEFAMGSSTENSAFGPTRNPWAADRAPGGSSGGSAAAVAADLTPFALGSDTGGSVRQPAAMCGVVGIKPTYGRVSRFGLLAFGSSLDQIGTFAHGVRDAARLLAVIAGPDPRDSTAAPAPVPDFEVALTGRLAGTRIGVPFGILEEGVDGDVLEGFNAALRVFEAGGASLHRIDLPHSAYAIPVYYLVATAEASSNLARYDGVRYGYRAPATDLSSMYDRTRERGFGPEVKRRIMLGTYVLSAGYYDAYYLKAQQVRTLIRRDYETALEQVDLVAMPTSPVPAFRLGERMADPLQMYLADVFTVGANLSGLPAISVPCGFTREGLPIGLQLMARRFEEETMLRAADAYERETDWGKRRPEL